MSGAFSADSLHLSCVNMLRRLFASRLHHVATAQPPRSGNSASWWRLRGGAPEDETLRGNLELQPAWTQRPRGVSSATPAPGTALRRIKEDWGGPDFNKSAFLFIRVGRCTFQNGLDSFFLKLAPKSFHLSAFQWGFAVEPVFWRIRFGIRFRFLRCFAFWKLSYKQVFWRDKLWRKSSVSWACRTAGKWFELTVKGGNPAFANGEMAWKIHH